MVRFVLMDSEVDFVGRGFMIRYRMQTNSRHIEDNG